MTPEDLVEIELIKRLKYAYARCIDTKNWAELETLFTEDAVASYSGGKYHHEGRDDIMQWLVNAMGRETFLSAHRMSHPEIDLTGPDTATGTWALVDVVIDLQWDITIRGASFYEDEYRKVDGEWKIARTAYKRSYEELQPRGNVPGLTLTASWWATNGQSTLDA
jgi:hypothetical protein